MVGVETNYGAGVFGSGGGSRSFHPGHVIGGKGRRKGARGETR